MRFPWPKDEVNATPCIHVVAGDPVWVGALRLVLRQPTPAALSEARLVVTPHGDLSDATHAKSLLNCYEADLSEVQRICDFLIDRPRRYGNNFAVLLAREAFADPHAQRLATTVLHEAGVRLVLSSPQQSFRVGQLAEILLTSQTSVTDDPLAELPLPCWDPAWQRAANADRV